MEREWTDEQIANLARGLRKFARQDLDSPLDIFEVMNSLQSDKAKPGLRMKFVEVPDSQLPYSRAEAEPRLRKIKCRRSLMEDLRNGTPEAIETMVEEIGHVLMHSESRVLNHFIGADFRARNIVEVDRKEQEARKFVWHVMAPIEEAYSFSSPDELRARWKMSAKVSLEYFDDIRRTKARIEGTGRHVPAKIIPFLPEALKRKYSVRVQPEKIPELSRSGPAPPENPVECPVSAPDESVVQCEARQMGYLPTRCPNPDCKKIKLRRQSGCTVCEGCGYSDGCD